MRKSAGYHYYRSWLAGVDWLIGSLATLFVVQKKHSNEKCDTHTHTHTQAFHTTTANVLCFIRTHTRVVGARVSVFVHQYTYFIVGRECKCEREIRIRDVNIHSRPCMSPKPYTRVDGWYQSISLSPQSLNCVRLPVRFVWHFSVGLVLYVYMCVVSDLFIIIIIYSAFNVTNCSYIYIYRFPLYFPWSVLRICGVRTSEFHSLSLSHTLTCTHLLRLSMCVRCFLCVGKCVCACVCLYMFVCINAA